jgi:hypothetical protein
MIRSLFRTWVDIVFDPILKLNLEVDDSYEKNREEHRKKFPPISVVPPELKPRPTPHIKKIHLKWKDNPHFSHCTISIDTEKVRIDYSRSTVALFKLKRGGHSSEIFLFLITLPVWIASIPLFWIAGAYNTRQEKRNGMSRHSWAVLRALKDQLDVKTHHLLWRAMSNSYMQSVKMSKTITFDEARALLSKSHLVIASGDEKNYTTSELYPWQRFHWFEDGEDPLDDSNAIASGKIQKARGERSVSVLGSEFEGQEVDELVKCFATKESWRDGEKQAD